MITPSASIPKPSVSPIEKLTRLLAAVVEEAGLRLEKAKSAYAAEMEWQKARRSPAPAPLAVDKVLVAGLAVNLETGECLILQEGLNVFGAESLRIEDGRAEGSGVQAGQSHFTNDVVTLASQKYLLKLFTPTRFTTRTQLQREIL